MEIIRQGKVPGAILMVLAGCLLLFCASVAGAEAGSSAPSLNGTILIEGVVRGVSTEKNMISVKVIKGEKIKIMVSGQTAFVGMTSLGELERGQRVKVWYRVVGEENRAVKIDKLPVLGC